MPRRVYVARHGETDWNVEGRWQGHTDIPLNDTGRAQAAALGERLRPHGVVAVVSSDLSRARETGDIVARTLGTTLAHVDGDLRERSFGVFEGLTREQCETLHAEAWQVWLAHRRAPGGAESQDDLARRMLAAIDRVAARFATDQGAAVVITHGGSMRALLAAAIGHMPPLVGNGAVWQLDWDGRVVGAEQLE